MRIVIGENYAWIMCTELCALFIIVNHDQWCSQNSMDCIIVANTCVNDFGNNNPLKASAWMGYVLLKNLLPSIFGQHVPHVCCHCATGLECVVVAQFHGYEHGCQSWIRTHLLYIHFANSIALAMKAVIAKIVSIYWRQLPVRLKHMGA